MQLTEGTRTMKITHTGWFVLTLVFAWLVWAFWYVEAGNFNDNNVCGTYVIQLNGEASTLVLRHDHSFSQERNISGKTLHAQGSWRLFPSDSQSHISFSSDFLKLPGQELNPDGTAYGQLKNRFGFLSLTLAPEPDGPTFYKRWLH
jgi:hypothetical protein